MKIKNLLIFFCVITVISVTMIWTFKNGTVPALPQQALQQLSRPDFSFSEIVISEVAGPVKHWEIRAQSAVIEKTQGRLKFISGTIFSKNRTVLTFQAPDAYTDLARSNFTLYTVTANAKEPVPDPWKIVSRVLRWNSRKELFDAEGNVRIWNKTASFLADKLEGLISLQTFALHSNVRAGFVAPSGDVRSAVSPDITMTCGTLLYDGELAYVTATGNISVHYGDIMSILCDQFGYDTRNSNSIARKGVVMEYYPTRNSAPLTVKADMVSYNAETREFAIAGHVDISYNDIRSLSRAAYFYEDKNLLECSGNVRASQQDQKFTGEKIQVYLDTKKIVSAGRTKFIAPKNTGK